MSRASEEEPPGVKRVDVLPSQPNLVEGPEKVKTVRFRVIVPL